MPAGLSRFIAVFSSSALLFSSSFAEVWTFSEAIGSAIAQQYRGRAGHFTESPAKPYLGKNPGKDKSRGGMWSASAIRSAYTYSLSQVTCYAYDDAGRQTGVDYPAGTDTAFSYDHVDRRTGMTDSTGSTAWTYNAASEQTAFTSPQGNLSYTYTSAGQRATMVDGTLTTTYSYDDAGRLTSLQNGYSGTTTFAYDDGNRLTKKTYSSGQYEDYAYDSRSRVTSANKAPIGDDGFPIEIHHGGNGLEEMTRTDHRLGDNFGKNHPGGSGPSSVNRSEFDKFRKKHWNDRFPRKRL